MARQSRSAYALAGAYARIAAVEAGVFPSGLTIGPTTSDPRIPVKSSVGINPAQAGTSDHVAHLFQSIVDGPWAESTGNDPNFAWGTNFFTLFRNNNGLDHGYGGLIEADISSAAGTTLGTMTGLQAECSFFGATAGATVTLMRSLYAAAPVRKNGATAGTATTVYGLHVGPVNAADTGATTAYGLFVQGGTANAGIGQSQLGGPVTINPGHAADVPLVIKMAPSPTGNAMTLFDATNGIKARITNAGIVASSNRVIGWEGNAAKQVTIGDQSPSNANAGVSFGTGNDTFLWRKAAGMLVNSTGDVTAPAALVGPSYALGNITTPPTGGAGNGPTGGGALFVQAGALKYIGSAGTVTTLAPA